MRLAQWLSAMPFRCVADVKTRWNFIEQSQTMRPIQDTINQAWKTIWHLDLMPKEMRCLWKDTKDWVGLIYHWFKGEVKDYRNCCQNSDVTYLLCCLNQYHKTLTMFWWDPILFIPTFFLIPKPYSLEYQCPECPTKPTLVSLASYVDLPKVSRMSWLSNPI